MAKVLGRQRRSPGSRIGQVMLPTDKVSEWARLNHRLYKNRKQQQQMLKGKGLEREKRVLVTRVSEYLLPHRLQQFLTNTLQEMKGTV